MAQPFRSRQVVHRLLRRIEARPRNILWSFLNAQAARLLSTATTRTCTFDNTTDIITSSGHGFVTAKGPIVFANSGGALPTGIAANTPYWPIRIDANTFRVATTRQRAATNQFLDFSTNGTGTNTAAYQVTVAAMFARLLQGVKPNTIRSTADIDNL